MQLGGVVSAQMGEDAPLVESGELASAWEALERASREQKFTPGVYVADALTGEVLLDKNGQMPMPPASTIKILTAINAAQSLDPASTLATRVFLDEDGTLHLVGEGDLLMAQGVGGPQVNGRAGVADLAAATAKALEDSQSSAAKLVFHDHIFDGPTREPALTDGLEHWVGHVAPFAIDRGEMPGVGYQPYYDDPAANVAKALQEELASAGVNVQIQASSEPYDGQGQLLAKVESAPIAQVTRMMLMDSDNTLAEQLCRLSSVAQDAGTTLEDAAQNLVEQVKNTGVYTDGLSAADCSGLNVENRVSPRTLVESLLYLQDARIPAAF
ncbi:D-alanyl-D-alanine carboxypeptidase, partial [Gleimia europaea]|nr:D-alanyl-D-alanine carboxypeptidase [Gleimia europaea]